MAKVSPFHSKLESDRKVYHDSDLQWSRISSPRIETGMPHLSASALKCRPCPSRPW